MSSSERDLPGLFLASIIREFASQKRMAERAVEQLPDEKLRVPLDENTNSIAVIMKHMAGNLVSRFSDFLTSDGEKPWRNRDGEFVDDDLPDRAALMAHWERGWGVLMDNLKALEPADLTRTVTIRGEPHSVPDALHRALAHQAYHVGQIVQLGRFLAKDDWNTLTIARGQSEQFNARMRAQQGKTT